MAKALKAAKAKAPRTADPASHSLAVQRGDVVANETSGPGAVAQRPDAPALGAASETLSTDTPPSDDQGGAGNAAGSAGSVVLDDALGTLDARGEHLDAEAEFRAKFPCMSAAFDAWKASNADGDVPTGIRVRSKIDDFRRAGIAHCKAPVEHRMEAFKGLEPMEALFAEPNLVVELI
jgi:hypothetical protein